MSHQPDVLVDREKRAGGDILIEGTDLTKAMRHALVFGATGFLGRHLVVALLDHGVAVTAACRTQASFDALSRWLAAHGCDILPEQLRVDFGRADCGVADRGQLTMVTEVYNCPRELRRRG